MNGSNGKPSRVFIDEKWIGVMPNIQRHYAIHLSHRKKAAATATQRRTTCRALETTDDENLCERERDRKSANEREQAKV